MFNRSINQMPCIVRETKLWPFYFNTLCFSFVESESTLGLILSCVSLLWFLLLFSTVKLICMLRYWSNSLLHMRSGALSGGIPRGSQVSLLISPKMSVVQKIGLYVHVCWGGAGRFIFLFLMQLHRIYFNLEFKTVLPSLINACKFMAQER